MTRRHPLTVGSRARHMDGRYGRVLAVDDAAELPTVTIQWESGHEETIAQAYAQAVGSVTDLEEI